MAWGSPTSGSGGRRLTHIARFTASSWGGQGVEGRGNRLQQLMVHVQDMMQVPPLLSASPPSLFPSVAPSPPLPSSLLPSSSSPSLDQPPDSHGMPGLEPHVAAGPVDAEICNRTTQITSVTHSL